MKALINKSNNSILTRGEETELGGPWGTMLKEGGLVWVEIPANESLEDCDYNPQAQALVVNNARKAQRADKVQDHESNLAKFQSFKKNDLKTDGVYDLEKVAEALLDISRVIKVLTKGL